MFLNAGFNPRGRVVCRAFMSTGHGHARWTRLYRFRCGEMAWIGRRFGFAVRDAAAVISIIELPVEFRTRYWGETRNVSWLADKPRVASPIGALG
jgi:hypothetical protein